MNEKQRLWYDNVLLRIGLIRVKHYTDLLERHGRLSRMYDLRMAYGDSFDDIPAYSDRNDGRR